MLEFLKTFTQAPLLILHGCDLNELIEFSFHHILMPPWHYLELQTTHPTAFQTSPLGCPTGISKSAHPKQLIIFTHLPQTCSCTSAPSSECVPTQVPKLETALGYLWSSLSHPIIELLSRKAEGGSFYSFFISFWSHCISWLLHLPGSTANVPDTLGSASMWVHLIMSQPQAVFKRKLFSCPNT